MNKHSVSIDISIDHWLPENCAKPNCAGIFGISGIKDGIYCGKKKDKILRKLLRKIKNDK